MLCMLCDARVTCPWEEAIEPVAEAAGWMTLPKSERRRSSVSVCGACFEEVFAIAGKILDAALRPTGCTRASYVELVTCCRCGTLTGQEKGATACRGCEHLFCGSAAP